MTAQLRENVATLEHRVEERTAELRQRNSELAIVNEVVQALAKQLDFTAILEAVGERAAEALSAKGLSIAMKPRDRHRHVPLLDRRASEAASSRGRFSTIR